MANYYVTAVFGEAIPSRLLSEKDMDIIRESGFLVDRFEKDGVEYCYFYAPEYREISDENDPEGGENRLFRTLQNIIKGSHGALPYLHISFIHTCSKYFPDGYGGSVVFITAKSIESFSTWQWVGKQISKLKSKKFFKKKIA